MLYEIMQTVKNYFVIPDGVHHGEWEIEGGRVSLPFLQEDAYFLVLNSLFNDGVYVYKAEGELGLKDEQFLGEIIEIRPDPTFLKLVKEIEEWCEKNNGKEGPYQSESFGGYSYTKASTAHGGAYSWEDAFKQKLRKWRKL